MPSASGQARDSFLTAMESALAEDASTVAVARVDLDRFERISQVFGPSVADTVHTMITARLDSLVDSDDRLVRLRDDAFILVLRVTDPTAEGLELSSMDIIDLISAPIDITGERIAVGCNVGIAAARQFAVPDPLSLIAGAEVAIQRADALGSRRVIVHEVPTRPNPSAEAEVFTDMLAGIEAGQFRPFFQPIMALPRTGVVGAEAVARWVHPGRGLVTPDQFIPEAEASGLIRAIDACIRQDTCAMAAPLPPRTVKTVHVNTSTADLDSPALTEAIRDTLTTTGLPAGRLVLEFNEVALETDWGRSHRRLEALRELGVRIGLDNFGLGHMQVDRLASGLFDLVKLDRSLVTTDAGPWQAPAVLMSGLAQLARGLGMDVVANGVETEEQLARAIDAGCTHAQGYWLGAPLPADDFARLWAHQA